MARRGRPPKNAVNGIHGAVWVKELKEMSHLNANQLGYKYSRTKQENIEHAPGDKSSSFYKYEDGESRPSSRRADQVGKDYPQSLLLYYDEIWELFTERTLNLETIIKTVGLTRPDLTPFLINSLTERISTSPLYDPNLYEQYLKLGLHKRFCGGKALRSILCLLKDSMISGDETQYWLSYQTFFRMIPNFIALTIPEKFHSIFMDYLFSEFESPINDSEHRYHQYCRFMVEENLEYLIRRSQHDFTNHYERSKSRSNIIKHSFRVLKEGTKILGTDEVLGNTYFEPLKISCSGNLLEFDGKKNSDGFHRHFGFEYYGAFYQVRKEYIADNPNLHYMMTSAIY